MRGEDPAERLRRALAVFAEGGVGLAQEELLDALWLAARLPAGASSGLARAAGAAAPGQEGDNGAGWLPSAVERPEEQEADRTAPRPRDPMDDAPAARHPDGGRPLTDQDARTAPGRPAGAVARRATVPTRSPLFGGATPGPRHGDGAVNGRLVRAPGTRATGSRQLQLARALRPLKQTVADHGRWELDETATAESTAHSGLTDAVLRPARARWLNLTLLVDDGASMLLWQQLALETRLLLERSGAFRDVRVHGRTPAVPGPRCSAGAPSRPAPPPCRPPP
ncbi:hypothetical protein [Streptomyces sp. KL118A]|uniref:hypothetical protein n=1 Tax=Streptomyces sp. KL118A TaxID=3045153 RepID=UPI00278C8562|nr:hypothetical protein [Streptomyces sp. KL118A]